MAESTVQKERRRLRLFSWTGAALVIGTVVAANFVLTFFPVRLDLSDGNVYSISDGTRSILRQLDDTLLVRVIFSSNLPPVYDLNQKYIADLLAEYRRASGGRIRVEYFDPGRSPQARTEAIEMGVAPVQLDIRERDRVEVKESFMGVAFLYGDRRESIPLVQDTQGLEYDITLRIKRLINPQKSRVGFASNGGSRLLDDPAMKDVAPAIRELYDAETVDLAQLPEGLKSVWLIGPTTELEEAAVAGLRKHVENGGSAGLLLDRYTVDLKQFRASPVANGLDGLLGAWGVRQREGLVSDPQSDRLQIRAVQGSFQMINLVDFPYFPWVTAIDRSHPATKDLEGFSMPFVSPFEVTERKAGLSYSVLARSTPMSFLNANPLYLNPLDPPKRSITSLDGPFDLALLVSGRFGADPAGHEGRVVLIGTSHQIDSEYPHRPSNYGFVLNLMDWSVQADDLLQIRAKGVVRRPLRELPDATRVALKYLMIFGLPLGAVAIGLIVWRRQKRRLALLPLVYREAPNA